MSIAQSCKIEGCRKLGKKDSKTGKRYLTLGMCSSHYQRRHKGFDISVPSKSERRPAVIEGDTAKIPLGVNAKDGYAIVDADMAWLADKHQFSKNDSGYAVTTTWEDGKPKVKRMHLLINGTPKDNLVTDHVNRNRLDNRRINLRFATRSENLYNQTRKNKTGYKGIYKSGNKWAARINIFNKTTYLGLYPTPEEAANAYNIKAVEIAKDFASLNVIKGEN